MRKALLIVFGGIACAIALIISANLLVLQLAPEWMAIVPSTRAAQFAELCSRDAPGPIQGTWTPQIEQVREAERRLVPLLTSKLVAAGKYAPTTNEHDYARQYAGLVVHGRRIIYINGWFAKWPPDTDRSMFSLSGSKPIDICDGGESAFGVEF
jgi:hypothetical protein